MILNAWLILGFTAQLCFFLRFLIQWIVSEKKKKMTIPTIFWYLSLGGGLGLLVYAIHIKDPVFMVGQSCGVFIYVRNLILVRREKHTEKQTKSVNII